MLENLVISILHLIWDVLCSKIVKISLSVCLASLLLFFLVDEAYDIVSPWSSALKVRTRILTLTPMGSSIEKVKSVVNEQHWEQLLDARFERTKSSMTSYPGVMGTHVIGVDFGHHFALPFSYCVDAYWGFDKGGKMIDLNVRFMPDGL